MFCSFLSFLYILLVHILLIFDILMDHGGWHRHKRFQPLKLMFYLSHHLKHEGRETAPEWLSVDTPVSSKCIINRKLVFHAVSSPSTLSCCLLFCLFFVFVLLPFPLLSVSSLLVLLNVLHLFVLIHLFLHFCWMWKFLHLIVDVTTPTESQLYTTLHIFPEGSFVLFGQRQVFLSSYLAKAMHTGVIVLTATS